jgi:RimJ/RimL family protein N-acetyltransferase
VSGVSIRRAGPDDVDFLVELLADDDVRPFLGPVSGFDRDSLLAEIERSQQEPESFGRFVIELDGERAGGMGFHLGNERSKIARIERLAVHPDFRGGRVAVDASRLFQRHLLVDLGYHRLELEVYAFNERGLAHTDRAGFIREGVKRRAYLREGEWVDSVMYSLLREDLGPI